MLDSQGALRARLEREPVDFLVRDLPGLLSEARAALSAFLGADPGGLAFVANATSGVNAVVRSLRWEPGDEILTTDHAYPACRKTLEYAAERFGARVAVAAVPFPLKDAEEVVAAVLARVSPRTRLAMLDHVTSPTALVFPVGRLVAELSSRGVDALVDGAHAPGMVPLSLDALGAAYYTGNAHKWLCAPKGAAFLYVRADRRGRIHPTVISHGFAPGSKASLFREEFDWTGTADPTPALSIPECLRYLGALLPGGWPEVMEKNRALALSARRLVAQALGVPLPAPEAMIGSMAAVPLPTASPGSPAARLNEEGLTSWFRERGVEPAFFPWPCAGGRLLRVSAQLYNSEEEYHALAALLPEALRGR